MIMNMSGVDSVLGVEQKNYGTVVCEIFSGWQSTVEHGSMKARNLMKPRRRL
jgi:hypothetical protein